MRKTVLWVLATLLTGTSLRADEGMWLPSLIAQRIGDMQAKGLRLEAEDIYSVNQASLKDAVVLFGSGCTGELVSADGLLFTNHHCGYSYIQRHSSVEHNYLKDGFWALSRAEELPNPGLTVSFLDHMDDVTAVILQGYDESMSEARRDSLVRSNSERLIRENTDPAQGLKASVESLFYGNQYFLFVFRVFRDVRLVGAPPSSIGKFGGDTDNWMWPRHTGDFSIFRVYAGPDNAPADYSPENRPYQPRKFFKINRGGVQEGDFTFVYGCPGSTQEYVMSEQVRYVGEVSDPQKIDLRTQRLDIQKKYMSRNPAVRIQYASKNATLANAWKKWQGETRGLARMKTVAAKQAYEARFRDWAKGTRYEGVVDELGAIYARRNPSYLAYEYYNETVRSIEIVQFAAGILSRLRSGAPTAPLIEAFYKDYYEPIDREVFASMVSAFSEHLPASFQPLWLLEKLGHYSSVEAWRDGFFAETVFTDRGKVEALTKADVERLLEDPAIEMSEAFLTWLHDQIQPVIRETNEALRPANRRYMQGQMAFEKEKAFYPDANLTLRVAYGQVAGYEPVDAVYYRPVSTLKGIIEKDNPDIFDYNIPQTLRDIYAEGGWDDQPVCFLATNHTTGGNSGSPVLNADGHLIGINFDRVWEGTMSDIAFDPSVCRNISLDVRYLLFVIDKIGHAGYLFDEMDFVD